ncbi:MAG: hypothetical protein IJJ79_00700, partial [Lachnospiraceae bacterium]|nr:hypothetical protein [Lachnospiraceae bacterium]
MKNRLNLKKKGMALVFAAVLSFASMSVGVNMRALAADEEVNIFSGLSEEYTYIGESLKNTIKDAVAPEANVTLSYYSGKNTSGNEIDPINVGTYTVLAKSAEGGGASGTVESKTFTITPANITVSMIGDIGDQIYTGDEIKPEPTVTFNKTVLTKGTDYDVTYENNVNAGTGRVTITGKGNFTATAGKSFKINQASITNATIADILEQQYTGSAIEPDPVVTFNGKTLKKGTDYNVTYDNNTEVGSSALVIVSG